MPYLYSAIPRPVIREKIWLLVLSFEIPSSMELEVGETEKDKSIDDPRLGGLKNCWRSFVSAEDIKC